MSEPVTGAAEPLDPIDPAEDESDVEPTDPEVVEDPEVPTEDDSGDPPVAFQLRSGG